MTPKLKAPADLVAVRDGFKALWADIHWLAGERPGEATGTDVQETLDSLKALAAKVQKAIDDRRTIAYTENTEDMVTFLAGVEGVIEADSFAFHALWVENKSPDGPKLTWESARDARRTEMTSVVVGEVDGRPVNVSLRLADVGGHRMVFYYACSAVVDRDMVRNFIDIAMPATAREGMRDNRVRHADANNWTNAIPRPWASADG